MKLQVTAVDGQCGTHGIHTYFKNLRRRVESGESVCKKVPTSSGDDLSLAGKGRAGLKFSLAKTWKMLLRRATILLVRLWRTFGWWVIVFMPI